MILKKNVTLVQHVQKLVQRKRYHLMKTYIQKLICKSVLIAIHVKELNKPEDIKELNCIEGYIVKNKNNEIRKVSSSGGVFFQIAQKY